MSIVITSTGNPAVKFARSLQKASVRKKEGLFLVEGIREIRLAMLANYRFHTLFYCPQIAERSHILASTGKCEAPGDIADAMTGQCTIIETVPDVFEKLAYRENSGGLLAIALQKKQGLNDIKLSENPLVLVAESVEKPGNLGALLRTADAAGVDAVLVCDAGTDIYNPNTVRSSLGTLFTLPVVGCSSDEAVEWLKESSIKIFTTALSASRPYYQADFRGPAAIVAGAEATGVSAVWEDNSDSNIIIPMFGIVDSINVSAATSIVLYEVLRQRGFE